MPVIKLFTYSSQLNLTNGYTAICHSSMYEWMFPIYVKMLNAQTFNNKNKIPKDTLLKIFSKGE